MQNHRLTSLRKDPTASTAGLRTAAPDVPIPIDIEPLMVRLPGRFLIQGLDEAQCTLVTATGRDVYVTTGDVQGTPTTDRIVLYLELMGRIEGTATWLGRNQMEVRISAPPAKLMRLQQQFALLAGMPPQDRENLRGHRRIRLDAPDVCLSLQGDEAVTVRIKDVSRSGAAIQAPIVPPMGEPVTLGSTRGRVVRVLEDGFAVQFARLLPLEAFGVGYRL